VGAYDFTQQQSPRFLIFLKPEPGNRKPQILQVRC